MRNKKAVKIKIKTEEQYIKLFNGIFNLTTKEIKVLAKFIRKIKEIEEEHSDENAFSTDHKKRMAASMGFDNPYAINMYVYKLKAKKAIISKNEQYIVNPILIPNKESSIIFNLTWTI